MQFTHLVIIEHKSHAIHTFAKLINIMGFLNEQDMGPPCNVFQFSSCDPFSLSFLFF
jgi:hypothetical protein